MSIISCDLCGGHKSVRMVSGLLGYRPGVHLCEVCRGCFWSEAEQKKANQEEFAEEAVGSPGFLNQWLIPHLLD